MQASLVSTRSFLSSQTGKLKSIHRRKNSVDSTRSKSSSQAESLLPSRAASQRNLPLEREREERSRPQPQSKARQQSLRETPARAYDDAVKVDAPSAPRPWTQPLSVQQIEDRSEKETVSTHDAPADASEPRTSEETMKEVTVHAKPFRGLDYPLDLGSDKTFIDDDFLKTAFGITMSRAASADGMMKHEKSPDIPREQMPRPSQSRNEDVFEMDVPYQRVQPSRSPSDLEISIPVQHPSPSRSPHQWKQSEVPQGALSAMSTSAPTQPRRPPPNAGPLAPIPVISPLGAVASPMPLRPFSTASIEGIATTGAERKKSPGPAMKSANSMSSDEISEQMEDGKSITHSPRSSMSSVNSPIGTAKGHDERRPSAPESAIRFDVAGASLYHAALAPKPSRSTSPYLNTPYPRPRVTRQGSATSLQSSFSVADVNKPLPPEPGRLSTISDNNSEDSSSDSRSSSITIRQPSYNQRHKGGGKIIPASSVRAINVTRMDTRSSGMSGLSLRSKYTPKDLDSLDDAFLQRKPPTRKTKQQHSKKQGSVYESYRSSPSQSQVSLATDRRLGGIKEEQGRTSRKGSIDPQQLSRGPMHMQPSRRPPQPHPTQAPTRTNSIANQAYEPPRPATRSQSSAHIGFQCGEEQNIAPPGRSATMAVGSSSKADRVLGKSSNSPPVRQNKDFEQERDRSDYSPPKFSSTGQPTPSGSSRQLSRDEMQSPDMEPGSESTPFDEIRQRLALLSPKEDPTVQFHAFRQRNAQRSTERLRTDRANAAADAAGAEAVKPQEKAAEPSRHRDDAPGFIAELEGAEIQRTDPAPAREFLPVELPGTEVPEVFELALPSPRVSGTGSARILKIPIPPEPREEPGSPEVKAKRGRVDTSNPQSSLSAKSRSLHSQGSARVRSLASLAASEIPDLYAHLPSPPYGSDRPSMASMTEEEIEQLVSAETAERVLLCILQSLDNLSDLFNAARVSRGFYRTFRRHELPLIKLALHRMSPAAAELREMSIPYVDLEDGATDYTPELYVRHYARDLMTMVKLKKLILENCESFLRHETIAGLAGETSRSPAIDEAFCRVWTFCLIFGCGKNREDDIVGQMDWLRGGPLASQGSDTRTLALTDELAKNSVLYNPPAGFASGNRGGLTTEELYDMTEIWTCLGVLIQGYQGRREEARELGIFQDSGILQGDAERENALLEEWTYHLLAHAPSTILDVASPGTPTEETFAHIDSLGYANWTKPAHGISRSTFLKEAVCRVYEEKMALSRPPTSTSLRSFSDLPQAVTPPSFQPPGTPEPPSARQRIAGHAAEIRAKKQQPNYSTMPLSPDRPMSNFNDVLNRLESLNASGGTTSAEAPAVPKVPNSLAARFSRRRPKVTLSPPSKDSRPNTPTVILESTSSSPVTPGRPNIGARISSLREKVTARASPPWASDRPVKPFHVSSPIHLSKERLPSTLEDAIAELAPRDNNERNPIDLAVDRLVAMGFEEEAAKKALAKSDSGNAADLEEATKVLIKQRKRQERLERLDTMG